MENKQGFVHLYIGDGKGKTTSAVGLATRAAGWNLNVLYCQFLKSTISGELSALESLNGQVNCFRPTMRHKSFIWNQSKEEINETREDILVGWIHIKELILSQHYDVIILDEVLDIVQCGFLLESELVEIVVDNLSSDIVLTGRDASDRLKDMADYVTSMTAVKHPYQKGIAARKGIEY